MSRLVSVPNYIVSCPAYYLSSVETGGRYILFPFKEKVSGTVDVLFEGELVEQDEVDGCSIQCFCGI